MCHACFLALRTAWLVDHPPIVLSPGHKAGEGEGRAIAVAVDDSALSEKSLQWTVDNVYRHGKPYTKKFSFPISGASQRPHRADAVHCILHCPRLGFVLYGAFALMEQFMEQSIVLLWTAFL
jgi:hypothetical protein